MPVPPRKFTKLSHYPKETSEKSLLAKPQKREDFVFETFFDFSRDGFASVFA
jgi:hypothetical protein